VVVVIAPHDTWWDSYDWSAFTGRVQVLRCGGETRADTVLNGLKAMSVDDDDWVLVHDAARPCITPALIDRLLAELADDAVGGLLAVPVADTLKRAAAGNRVAATEARDALWQAQTPQMFRRGMLRRGLEGFGNAAPTDEAQAIERMGLAPKLVLGERNNLKVTFPEDLDMAGMLLQARNRS
jgi:2-C-methyl-D-erythritol 4-phosphate cytidylyltransferase